MAVIFVSKLEKLTHKIYNDFYRKPIPMKLDMTRQQEYYSAYKCHICGGELNHDRVRDHCHFTGVYRGAAHNRCNLQCRKPMIFQSYFIIFRVMMRICLLNNLRDCQEDCPAFHRQKRNISHFPRR